MSSTADPITHGCAQCGKQATLKCKGCMNTPDGKTIDGVIVIRYCGIECQKSNWSTHQPVCKTAQLRKKIYRAGSLAREACLTFNRITYSCPVDRIEKLGNTWKIYAPEDYKDQCQLMPFPPDCVTSPEEENALLSFGHCTAALCYQHHLFKDLLRSYCSAIEETSFKVKNRSLRLLFVFADGFVDHTDYYHTILKVTVKNGEQYALDVAGAQNGWHESVVPWEIYANTRVQCTAWTLQFGQTQDQLHAKLFWDGDLHSYCDQVLVKFAKKLRSAADDFQKRQVAFKALLNLPEGEYEAKCAVLIDGICHALEAFKVYGEKRGLFQIKVAKNKGRGTNDPKPKSASTMRGEKTPDVGMIFGAQAIRLPS